MSQRRPLVEQALHSALDQTWPRLEVIVVDDGSTDGSFELARRLGSSRCHVMRQEQRGASAARNRALRVAQGSFIQYLDADDFLSLDKIALQMDAMRDLGSGCLSWSSVRYQFGGAENDPNRLELAREMEGSATHFLAQLWGGDGEPGTVLVHQWLTPRVLIERAGPWNETLAIDDDGEFFARVVLASRTRIPAPKALCFYRKFHSCANLSGRVKSARRYRESALEATCMKAGHLLALVPDDPFARRAVSRLLTQQIVDAYPDPGHRRGLEFLRWHDLPLSPEFAAPPWLLRVAPLIGWKAARRLQNRARAWRECARSKIRGVAAWPER